MEEERVLTLEEIEAKDEGGGGGGGGGCWFHFRMYF